MKKVVSLRIREGWAYVEGARGCAFYQLSGKRHRVIHIAQTLAPVVRAIARGEALKDSTAGLPLKAVRLSLRTVRALSCLVESSEEPRPWPRARAVPLGERIQPRGAFLELTNACNFRCIHCYAGSEPKAFTGELTTSEWVQIIQDLRAAGFEGVMVTGGDPLLRRDFPILLKQAASVFPGHVVVLTNGSLVNRRLARLLARHASSVSLSFYSHDPDSADRVTGTPRSFERTVRGIKLLLEEGVDLSANIVLTPETQPHLAATRRLLRSLGIRRDRMGTNPVLPAGRGCASRVDLQLLQGRFPHQPFQRLASRSSASLECLTCWSGQVAITSTGDVLICDMIRSSSVGDLRRQTVEEVVRSEACQAYWRVSLDDVETCCGCELRFACHDCRTAAILLTGDDRARNPLCPYDPLKGEWRMTTHLWERRERGLGFRPRRREGLLSRTLDDEIIVYDGGSQSVFSLNPVAARIFVLCDGERTLEEIVEALEEEYDVDRARLVQDVSTAIDYLVEHRLLKP